MDSTYNASLQDQFAPNVFSYSTQEVSAQISPIVQTSKDSFTRLLLVKSLQILLIAICFLHLKQVYFRYSWNAPKNVHIVGYLTVPGKWLTGLLSGHRGDEMLQWGFEKSSLQIAQTKALAKPFALPTLGRYIVFATGPDHYEEINRASGRVLSLGGMIHDVGGLCLHQYAR
ncbi:MAG: hypothetical protein Q9159_007351 [Coniocarpon cinnabarinum]